MVMGERNDLKEFGRRLTNREIYNYIKERSVAKPHKLAGIIRKHCITIEFMDDLEESARGLFRGQFSSFLKREKSF